MPASLPIYVDRLTKHYHERSGRDIGAASEVSFEVVGGECFGLLGPNRSGKTTTIKFVSGFYPPSESEVFVNGYNVYLHPKCAPIFGRMRSRRNAG